MLIIDNKTQEQALEREKQNLLDHLRNTLKNTSLTFESRIEETGDDVHLYTTKDKFKKLADKNPNIIDLKNRLNLDFDF